MEQLFNFLLEHWVLSSVLLVLIVLFINNEIANASRGINFVSPQKAVTMLNHDDALMVDIRDNDSFNSQHVLGAINLPASQDINNHLRTLKKHKQSQIILIGGQGQSCANFGKALKKAGSSAAITQLHGGINGWKEAGLPLVKSAK